VGLLYVLLFESVMVDEFSRLAGASLWRINLGATLHVMPPHFPAQALLAALGDWVPSLGSALIVTGSVSVVALGICTVLLKRTDAI
jgi:hypothetical protein